MAAHAGKNLPELLDARRTRKSSKSFGGEEEDRTPDLRIANATLSQLSYFPMNRTYFSKYCRSCSVPSD